MGIELKTKQGNITLTAPKVVQGGSVDLSNYYTKTETDETFLSKEDFETIVPAFLTDIPDEYITEDELEAKDYATVAQIPDVSGFITADDIPDVSAFLTADDISGFQTEEQVIALIKEHGGGGTLPASEEGEF